MRRAQLERALNRALTARDASDWRGKFTLDIRTATMNYRQQQIAEPLDEVISFLRKELDKATRKRKNRTAVAQRLPYLDD